MKTLLVICTICACIKFGLSNFDEVNGYTPVSDVVEHSEISLDVCAIKGVISEGLVNYSKASSIYMYGENSMKTSGSMRTLVDMAQKSSTSPLWSEYVAYFSGATWMDDLVTSALSGEREAHADHMHSGEQYTWTKEESRKKVIIMGTSDQILAMYAIHELDYALEKLSLGSIDPSSGAPHAWDEGFAFYSGTQDSDCAPYRTAEKLAVDFGTTGTGKSRVNELILNQFVLGQEACLRVGGLSDATSARKEIVRLMSIPYAQGTLKAAAQLDDNLAASENPDKHQAEAWMYFRQIEAQVAHYDLEGAVSLSSRFHVNNAASDGNYAATYCVFDGVLSSLELAWSDIGSYPNTPQNIECSERTISGSGFGDVESAVPGQCPADLIETMSDECSVSPKVSPLLGHKSNTKEICSFKHSAVDCMHLKAQEKLCSLPNFGVPIEIKVETYSDRRRSLLAEVSEMSAQERDMNLRLGITESNNLDCCSWYKDTYEKSSSGDRRRSLLSSSDNEKEVREAFCLPEDDNENKNTIFSVPALFIIYRETVEAAIIVAVLLQFMDKTKQPELKKWVWFGSMAGVVCSIALGVIFIAIYYVARDNLFSGDARYIFEGIVSTIATIMITILAFCMLRMWNMQEKWEKKLAAQFAQDMDNDEEKATQKAGLLKDNQWTVFTLAFSAVFREGVESVVFLAGIGANTEATAIPIPGILGVILGVFTGVVIFRSGGMLKTLKALFTVFTVVLLVIAAGIFMYGLHEFQEASVFGTWSPKEDRAWHNEALWDISSCCDHKDEGFFALLRALVGYTATPTFVEIMGYLCYWILVLSFLTYRYMTGTLTTKDLSKFDHKESDSASTVNGVTGGKGDANENEKATNPIPGTKKLIDDCLPDVSNIE